MSPIHQTGQELGLTKLSSGSHQGIFTRVCPDLWEATWLNISSSGNPSPNLPEHTNEDAINWATDPHTGVISWLTCRTLYSSALCYNLCVNTLARCALYRDSYTNSTYYHLPTPRNSEGCTCFVLRNLHEGRQQGKSIHKVPLPMQTHWITQLRKKRF